MSYEKVPFSQKNRGLTKIVSASNIGLFGKVESSRVGYIYVYVTINTPKSTLQFICLRLNNNFYAYIYITIKKKLCLHYN